MAKKSRIRGYCVDCSKGITGNKAKRCHKCAARFRYKTTMPISDYKRNFHMKRKYGMDLLDFEVYWQASKGKCFICGKLMKLPELRRGQSIDTVVIDHDHKTKKFRGLLCRSCNNGLGYFKDDINLIKKAFIYLEMSK